MAKFCMRCGANLGEGAKFCPGCGYPVVVKQTPKKTRHKFCMKCGAPLREGAKFCMKCGKLLADLEQTPQTKVCLSCGEPMKADMRFCFKCGRATGQLNEVEIPVKEPVLSVEVRDEPPVIRNRQEESDGKKQTPQVKLSEREAVVEESKLKGNTREQMGHKVKRQGTALAKKALSEILNQTVDASKEAGEMLIPMTKAQKSCLSDAIRQLTKMVRR